LFGKIGRFAYYEIAAIQHFGNKVCLVVGGFFDQHTIADGYGIGAAQVFYPEIPFNHTFVQVPGKSFDQKDIAGGFDDQSFHRRIKQS
jgi:serine acetyltransferase